VKTEKEKEKKKKVKKKVSGGENRKEEEEEEEGAEKKMKQRFSVRNLQKNYLFLPAEISFSAGIHRN
jgi:hypothetical protein